MKKPFVVSVSVSFLVLLAGYFFHQEITSRNLPKPDHIKIVSVPDGFILDEKQPIEEVGALRAELEQLKEEFKLIRINSGRMVEQMNALTKLVHEIRKSPKIAEQTNTPRDLLYEPKKTQKQSKTIYVPYRETGDSTHQMDRMLPMVLDNDLQLQKINRNLDNIEFQLRMNSLRHGN